MGPGNGKKINCILWERSFIWNFKGQLLSAYAWNEHASIHVFTWKLLLCYEGSGSQLIYKYQGKTFGT